MVESTRSLHVNDLQINENVNTDEINNELSVDTQVSPSKVERKKRYKQGKILDHGSFGIVYEGTDTLTS